MLDTWTVVIALPVLRSAWDGVPRSART